MEFNNDNVFIGNRQEWGKEIPFGLNLSERSQHAYIIGQTGTGKSTLLQNLILQDIEAGRGVAVIDPHGDLAKEILDHIPSWRTDDVVYFDPLCEKPVAVDLFRAAGENWHLAASGIVSAFKKIWADSWGARLEYILFATLSALIQCENTSLLGISRMLYDPRYRLWIVRRIKDPMVRSFWINEFEMYEGRFLQEVIAPVQNKAGQVFLSPPLRFALGQVTSKVNFRFMMDRGRIFIANLGKGQLGEAHSSLLGALLVTGFELAALSRSNITAEERRDFFLYVDEFQNCATDSFASILSESRKYGLRLTLAHQYMGQLSQEISDAIFGNVGTFLSFRVGEADADVLSRQYGGDIPPSRFSSLENYEICARLLNREPFLGKCMPPLKTSRQRRRSVMRSSRRKYGTRRDILEEQIERWLRNRH